MLRDYNKGISSDITYNHLNLPTKVTFTGTNKYIDYIYDASGIKLEKKVTDGSSLTTTKYAGNYIYEKIGTGSDALKFFNHAEGYVDASGSGYEYVYQYKDHLGNVRLSYKDTNGDYEQILDSDFESDIDGWVYSGSVTSSFENGKLKLNVNSSWEGIKHYLDNFNVSPGETYNVKLVFDKGNTQAKVRLYFQELDANGNHLSWNTKNGNLTTGSYEYSHTVVAGNKLVLRIDKDNTYTGNSTYFYVDHVSLTRSSLEILEENNYYPFGLKHEGYNNTPVTNHPYKYANKELEESLGLNMYDYGARYYDPATARFNKIDRFAEKYDSNTPYAFVANSPIKYSDYNGDWIYINDGGNRYRYENGSLYSKNEETGEYDVKYKAAAGSYSATIAKALSKLEGTLSGSDLTSFFANDTDNVFIQKKAAGKKGNSQIGSFVKTDPNNKGAKVPTEDDVVESPFFVSLGHEIAHRRDLITNGNSIFNTWLTLSNGKTVKEAEKYASHIENMIRQENGLPLRTHYVLARTPSGALSGFGPSALLNSDGNSNFFKAPATMEITDDNGNNAITIRLKTTTTQQYNYKNQSSYGTQQD